MTTASFSQDLTFNESKVSASLILETSFSKEMRILLKKGQIMKEHKTPFPILVHLLSGQIDFRIQEETLELNEGAMLTLEENIPHDLRAIEDSVVRLTLSKLDKAERVENLAQNS